MYKNSLNILFLIAFVPTTWADDAIEASATGNIVFEKTSELIMRDETLTITKLTSRTLGDEQINVDVDFHFKNTSDHDVTRKIAFVLPPVLCREDARSSWGGLDSYDANSGQNNGLKDFTTTVNNHTQSYTMRTEAMLGQRNITELLTQLKIPLNPCKIQMTSEGKPDPKYGSNLKKQHLLTEANEAAWSENIYFEWTQTFPAGKNINIHHHYTTVSGGAVLAPRTIEELNNEFIQNTPPLNPVWNRSPNTLIASNPAVIKTNGDNVKRFCVMPKWVQYHLTTGANWNKGIGTFKFIIKDDAGAPFAVNKFYKNDNGEHPSINGNSMTFTIKNFIPTQNLLVQFLSLPQSPKEFHACR